MIAIFSSRDRARSTVPMMWRRLPQDLMKIDISLTAGDSADENDPASQRHCFEAGGEIRTSIQIKYDVKSAAAGHALGKIRKPCSKRSAPELHIPTPDQMISRAQSCRAFAKCRRHVLPKL